jgi:CRP/FNR family cyclic AMP-dependent transcriptional regulator
LTDLGRYHIVYDDSVIINYWYEDVPMTTPFNLFRNSTDVKTFTAGEVIFKQGQIGDFMYVVQEGEVDILIGSKVIETVEPGGLLGELALIDNRPRAATAIARTDCKVVPIDETRFEFMVQQTPAFAVRVMEVMAERLRYMDALADTHVRLR